MTVVTEVNLILEQIQGAEYPEDVFGQDEPRATYLRLQKLTHPDKHTTSNEATKRAAEEASHRTLGRWSYGQVHGDCCHRHRFGRSTRTVDNTTLTAGGPRSRRYRSAHGTLVPPPAVIKGTNNEESIYRSRIGDCILDTGPLFGYILNSFHTIGGELLWPIQTRSLNQTGLSVVLSGLPSLLALCLAQQLGAA